MATITSVNSTFTLVIKNLYPTPLTLQGYSVDDAFAGEDIDTAQVQMGVDGFLAAGYVPVEKRVTIMLQANSPSMDIFDNWQAAQTTIRELYEASGTIAMPSLGSVYAFTKGYLTSASTFSSAKKVHQPRRFVITFQEYAWSRV